MNKKLCRLSTDRILRKTRLKRPNICESCKDKKRSTKGIHLHHLDYREPTLFLFLCVDCHGFTHSFKIRNEELRDMAKLRSILLKEKV